MRAASIGECMIEFHRRPDGSYGRGWGGDTLNVALYMARLGIAADYVTMLGDDALSEEMLVGWAAEGVGTGLVGRVPGRVPGLYLIETDASGERTFLYWRSAAPVRDLMALRGQGLGTELAEHALIYLSGITLSLFDRAGRERLVEVLAELRRRGSRVAFDGNYRTRGWPDPEEARAAFTAVLRQADIALPTFDDEAALFGDGSPQATIERMQAAGVAEIAVKCGAQACLVAHAGTVAAVPVPRSGRGGRHDGRRRQLQRRVSRAAAPRRVAQGCGCTGPSPGGGRDRPPWRHYPTVGHAAAGHRRRCRALNSPCRSRAVGGGDRSLTC